jgi:YidC/Oxa1 family membrane protein insertase
MDFILNPFVTILTLLYQFLGSNMVLAIIVFTILVKLATYPLTVQQLRSSQKMQELQPEIKKLQEKYKNDREKLSQEQMALYRQYGINPVGGCLPLLIQFPIFIALYSAINFALAATPTHLMDLTNRLLLPGLDSAIPLNNMWLGLDLTQPPNIYAPSSAVVLIVSLAMPILTMVTTWLSFKVSMPPPAPSEDGKPNQMQTMTQSMSTIMPLMYGFFALSFSVGLSIYFIVSNIIQIVQYAMMGRANFSNIFGSRIGSRLNRNAAPPATITAKATAGTPAPAPAPKPAANAPRLSGSRVNEPRRQPPKEKNK